MRKTTQTPPFSLPFLERVDGQVVCSTARLRRDTHAFLLVSPRLGLLWFTVASLIVSWDSAFVLLRPKTLPGGDWHHFFKPYALYIQIDTRYGDMTDTFGYAQSWANVVEIVLNFATVTLVTAFCWHICTVAHR
jgi:hypothetical protein